MFRSFLVALSGAILISGCYQAALAVRRRGLESLALVLGCLSGFWCIVCNIHIYGATTTARYLSIARIQMFGTAGFALAALWLGALAGRVKPVRILLPFGIAHALPAIAVLAAPELPYAHIDGIRYILTPWGEKLAEIDATRGWFGQLDTALFVLSLAVSAVLFVRRVAGERSRTAILDAGSFTLLALAVVHDAFLGAGMIRSVPLVEVASTALLVTMGLRVTDHATRAARLEVALAESERRLGAVFNSTYQLVGILDPAGRVLAANQTALKYAGTTLDRVQGMHLWDTPWWAGLQEEIVGLRSSIERAAAGEFVRFTAIQQRADDALRTFDFSLTPVAGQAGADYLIAEGRDITDLADALRKLRETEGALEGSRRELASILRNAPDIIYRLDPEGRITFLSDAVRGYGYDPAEMAGKPLMDYVHPEDRAAAMYRLNERRTGARSTRSLEVRLFARGGSVKTFEYRSMAIDAGPLFLVQAEGLYGASAPALPEFLGTQGIARDITERKLAEKAVRESEARLVQAQKMEAIGTLTSGIAHDFNNILVGIMGSLSFLQDVLKTEPITQQKQTMDCVETALRSSSRAAAIVKQLLALARKQEMSLVPMDLVACVRNVVALCRGSFPKCVTIDMHAEGVQFWVRADPARVELMLLNICVNAMHAMTVMRAPEERQGGTVTIEAGAVAGSSEHLLAARESAGAATYACVTIRDTGVGMDEATRLRVFDPFFTRKEGSGGTGLGLSMTYATVEQLGGFITVASTPGEGSSFGVYLPAIEPQAAAEAAPEQAASARAPGGRILVVDDEPVVRHLAESILTRAGYAVVTAAAGPEGIDRFTAPGSTFDLVILDHSMPEMTGVEVAVALRNHDPAVRIILSSGLLDIEEVEPSARGVVRAFLTKPYMSADLLNKVREVLG